MLNTAGSKVIVSLFAALLARLMAPRNEQSLATAFTQPRRSASLVVSALSHPVVGR
ncbi:MAG: hypothetical protein U0528_17190 [Anaerolineae bacterium]